MNGYLLNLIYAVSGVAGLYYGAEFLVKGGTAVARKAGVSQLVIGLTLVAFATSAPELVVSVSAALEGNADISLGNVVGSNICNIALILGLCACISPVAVQPQLLRFDAPVLVAASVCLTVIYFISHGVTRAEGAVLFLGILTYTIWNVYASRKSTAAAASSATMNDEVVDSSKKLPLWLALILVLLGFAFLVFGAKLFLWGAVFFARKFQLPDAVIGLTIVAVGTSLPELATSVVAAIRGENDIAIGNVLGSNIFNILCILGITPLICPLRNATLDFVDLGVMLFCTVVLVPMMRTGWKVSRKEGAFLLFVYLGYTAYLLFKPQITAVFGA